MNDAQFTPITPHLQVLHLKKTRTNLMEMDNRRFMYHPSGILILGQEDMVNSSHGLYKSHAEEHGDACDLLGTKLPPYDEFVRGWIGVGGDYRDGIIHFAPHITGGYLPQYEAAFSFIEMALQNGFTEKATLRGFCEPWEQTISHMLAPELNKHKGLDQQIQTAEGKRGQETQSRPSSSLER